MVVVYTITCVICILSGGFEFEHTVKVKTNEDEAKRYFNEKVQRIMKDYNLSVEMDEISDYVMLRDNNGNMCDISLYKKVIE